MLDRARDADGEVQVGCNDLSGLADLHVVGHVACVNGSTGSANTGTHGVCELVDDLEAFGATESPAAGYNLGRCLQVRAIGGRRLQLDDSDVADRHDMKKIKIGRLKPSWLEPDVTSQLTLFQYMIGNVDWAALSGPDPQECCHNAKLIAVEPIQKNGDIYPIPYDFDSAGFVDAPYAAPPQGLPIRRVTQRLYRGYCVSNPYMEDARKHILDQERPIMALVKEEPRLNSKTRSEAEGYLADFFEIIKDNRDWNRNIIEKCRK